MNNKRQMIGGCTRLKLHQVIQRTETLASSCDRATHLKGKWWKEAELEPVTLRLLDWFIRCDTIKGLLLLTEAELLHSVNTGGVSSECAISAPI